MNRRTRRRHRAHDCIIVLGAAVHPGGTPSPGLRRRVSHAAKLMHQQAAPAMIVTGGLGDHPPEEAVVMRNTAVTMGVPERRIILEPRATSTYESAVNCLPILNARGWRTALIVSDTYHLPRAVTLFRALGVDAHGSGVRGWRRANSPARQTAIILREILALLWYAVRIAADRWRSRSKAFRKTLPK